MIYDIVCDFMIKMKFFFLDLVVTLKAVNSLTCLIFQ